MATDPRRVDDPAPPATGERPVSIRPQGTADTPVRRRCAGCGLVFALDAPGVAPCPRCQSVDEHEPVGPAGGDDGGE